jgi:AAA15 family ATPase/GTPase
MISSIKFRNYKVFKDWQFFELKPITILIGKNSSGKSAILNLLPMIEDSINGKFTEPLLLNSNGIEFGGEFKDLVYGRSRVGKLDFILKSESDTIEITIGSGTGTKDVLEILSCKMNGTDLDTTKTSFTGFLPMPFQLKSLSFETDYISSNRIGIKRLFEKPVTSNKSVGINGEKVYDIIIEDALTTPQLLLKAVSEFYKNNFEGWGLDVNGDRNPYFEIEFVHNDLKINIKDVGLGMIHALPLVTRALMSDEKETIVIIEEPEMHLHPAAHGNLAQLFVETLTNKRYVIETHSQNFVLRLRRLVAEGKLDKSDLVIYYTDFDNEKNESNLIRMNVDELGKTRREDGEIFWPSKIFSETLDETSALRTAQINNSKSK